MLLVLVFAAATAHQGLAHPGLALAGAPTAPPLAPMAPRGAAHPLPPGTWARLAHPHTQGAAHGAHPCCRPQGEVDGQMGRHRHVVAMGWRGTCHDLACLIGVGHA